MQKILRTIVRHSATHALLVLLLCTAAPGLRAQSGVSFLVVGDWGTGGKGARQVGSAMAMQHAMSRVDAVISTGDNIYPSGVKSVDDPQWRSKFENIYPADKLPVPFWAVLGNHDYRSSPDAQVAYTGHVLPDGSITRWHMPGYGWSTVFKSEDGALSVRLIGIDTQQLVGSAAARKKHLRWIDSALALAHEDYTLVIGHHPVYSHGHYGDTPVLVKQLAPLLEKYGVGAYLDGHEHDLQLMRRINGVRYIISGGGGGTRKTSMGKNSEFASSSLGFFRLDFSKEKMCIRVFDSHGALLHETADLRR
ncbi:MAG: metallophosphoesterase [Bacteroidetes bacterium]|nr:metallophosphoesterase [Bacteroidota bacterium]